MNRLRSILWLLHPVNGLSSGIAVVAGYWITVRYTGTPVDFLDIVLAVITVFCASSAGFVINDIQDVDIDRVNRPDRPIPAGLISIQQAKLIYGLLVGVSIVLALFLSVEILVTVILVNLSLFLYSVWLKEKLLIGHAIIAINGGILLVFGGLVTGSITPNIYTVPGLFFAFFAREVLKTLPDLEGDKSHGVNNLATKYGVRVAANVSKIAFVSSFILYSLLSLVFDTTFLLLVMLVGVPLVFFFIPRINPDRDLRAEILISKMIFLIMIIPIVVVV